MWQFHLALNIYCTLNILPKYSTVKAPQQALTDPGVLKQWSRWVWEHGGLLLVMWGLLLKSSKLWDCGTVSGWKGIQYRTKKHSSTPSMFSTLLACCQVLSAPQHIQYCTCAYTHTSAHTFYHKNTACTYCIHKYTQMQPETHTHTWPNIHTSNYNYTVQAFAEFQKGHKIFYNTVFCDIPFFFPQERDVVGGAKKKLSQTSPFHILNICNKKCK